MQPRRASVANDGAEKNMLRNYKTNARLYDAEQKKLAEAKMKANELRFKTDRTAEETKQLNELDAEAKRIEARVNRYVFCIGVNCPEAEFNDVGNQ